MTDFNVVAGKCSENTKSCGWIPKCLALCRSIIIEPCEESDTSLGK